MSVETPSSVESPSNVSAPSKVSDPSNVERVPAVGAAAPSLNDPANTVFYLPFAADLLDDSAQAQTWSTYAGTPAIVSDPGSHAWATNCAQMDVDNWGEVVDDATLHPASDAAWAIDGWHRYNGSISADFIAYHGNTNVFSIYLAADKSLSINAGAAIFAGVGSLNADTWNHLCVTHDGAGNYEFLVDGVSIATASSANRYGGAAGNWRFRSACATHYYAHWRFVNGSNPFGTGGFDVPTGPYEV